MLHGFDGGVERRPEDTVNWDLAVWRDDAFARAGVQRPVDLMPGIEPLSELYWFVQNVSPGAFFLPRFRAKMTAERIAGMRKHFQGSVGRLLSGRGF